MKKTDILLKLESDIVISSIGATEGSHETLDYIPGSVILGTVASRLGNSFDPKKLLSGAIRFSNALPFVKESVAYPIPLSWHKPKIVHTEKILNGVSNSGLKIQSEALGDSQFKQMRSRYFYDDQSSFVSFEPRKNRKTMSSIDRTQFGRTVDGNLFSYESLRAGTEFVATITADDSFPEDLWKSILGILQGRLKMGKSRSAEFGAVDVKPLSSGIKKIASQKNDKFVSFYLASDLWLVHDSIPTLLPEAKDFGLGEGKLDLTRTYIRTRSYSPWNAYFKGRQEERNVIVKGSVITFICSTPPDLSLLQAELDKGIGLHVEEGLGQVLVNPDFLITPKNLKESEDKKPMSQEAFLPGSTLALYLKRKVKAAEMDEEAYSLSTDWTQQLSRFIKKLKDDKKLYPSKTQWSNVRAMCLDAADSSSLKNLVNNWIGSSTRKKQWTEVWQKVDSLLHENHKEQVKLKALAITCHKLRAHDVYKGKGGNK